MLWTGNSWRLRVMTILFEATKVSRLQCFQQGASSLWQCFHVWTCSMGSWAKGVGRLSMDCISSSIHSHPLHMVAFSIHAQDRLQSWTQILQAFTFFELTSSTTVLRLATQLTTFTILVHASQLQLITSAGASSHRILVWDPYQGALHTRYFTWTRTKN